MRRGGSDNTGIRWLLRCSHLVFPCAVLCVLLGLVSSPRVGRPCSQLLGCVRSSQFGALFSFSAGALNAAGVRCQGRGVVCRSVSPLVAVGLSHCPLGGTRGTRHFCTCLQICKLTCPLCLLGLFCGECHVLLLLCILGC